MRARITWPNTNVDSCMNEDEAKDLRDELDSEEAKAVFDQLAASAAKMEEESAPMPEALKEELTQHWSDEEQETDSKIVPMPSSFRQWRTPLVAIAAVLMLALVIMLRNPEDSSSLAEVPSLPNPSGYVMISEGNAELRRAGETYAVNEIAELATGDELILPEGTAAFIQRADGQTETLAGPQRYALTDFRPAPGDPAAQALFGHASTLDALWTGATRAGDSLDVYSPIKTTTFTNPPLLLGSPVDNAHTVRIEDETGAEMYTGTLEANQPWLIMETLTLSPGDLYDLVIIQNDEEVLRTPFLVAADAAPWEETSPTAMLQAAVAKASHPGDVLALLSRLPDTFQKRSLVQRLRLLALSALGIQTAFDQTLAELKATHEL